MDALVVREKHLKSITKAIAKRNANKPKPEPKPKYSKSESKKRGYYTRVICNNDYIRPLFSIDEYVNVL